MKSTLIINIKELSYNSGIYKLNYDNGKIYVGQATAFRDRANDHNSKNKYPCDTALKKHNAIMEILQDNVPIEKLDEAEYYWIKFYNATDRNIGYNILDYGNVSGRRGIENYNAIFNTQDKLNEVIDLLINHLEYSYIDIAKKYSVNPNTIYRINQGISYKQDNLKYPLRNNKVKVFAKKDHIDDYNLTVKDIIEIKEDLKYRWDLTIEKDLPIKYNIPLQLVRDINQGRKFSDYGDYNYLIKNKNIRNNIHLTQQDVINILNDLRNTALSQTKIGEKYCINRSTVANINLGKVYIIKNYDYPARTKEQVINNFSYRKTQRGHQVQCLNTNQIFNFITEASKWCNVSESCIRACANGKQKTAGKHPETKESLKWKWIE